jgi:predicted tellurium resistance membrane protein TerC
MFAVVFVLGFIFSLIGLTEFARSLEKKKSPWLGLISCLVATVVWISFSLVWVLTATLDMFVAFGNLFIVFGIIFLILTIACAGLALRFSAKPEDNDALTIRERSM